MKRFVSFLIIAIMIFTISGCSGTTGGKIIDDTPFDTPGSGDTLPDGNTADVPDTIDEQEPATLIDGTPIEQINIYGNSVSNLASGGRMAFQGNSYYFADEDEGGKLYRVTDGKKIRLSERSVRQINVIGNSVFYIAYPQRELYRADIDGANEERLLDDRIDNLCVSSGIAYFSLISDSYKIYKYDLAAKVMSMIIDASAFYIHLDGGYIYYQTYSGSSYKLMRAKQDGSGKKQVCDLVENCMAIAYTEDRIYYRAVVKISGTTKYRLYSINKDGGDAAMLTANEPYYINATEDKIYYANADASNKVFSINPDGTGNMRMADYPAQSLYTSKESVYYSGLVPGQGYKLLKL